nr:hypothetical protein LOC_Os12g34640 [Oryza sativa Japonica Group]
MAPIYATGLSGYLLWHNGWQDEVAAAHGQRLLGYFAAAHSGSLCHPYRLNMNPWPGELAFSDRTKLECKVELDFVRDAVH